MHQLPSVNANRIFDGFKNKSNIFNNRIFGTVNGSDNNVKDGDTTNNDKTLESNGPFEAMLLKRYISSRTKNTNRDDVNNSDNSNIWSYEGRLIDPFTNRVIADVEGAC